MSWCRALAGVLAAAGAASLWLPWVGSRSAALVLTGLDLPEFVRFMGVANSGLVLPTRVLFALPLLAAGVVAIVATGLSASLWNRLAALGVAMWLASVAFSPLELRAWFLAAAGLMFLLWLVAGRLPPSVIGAAAQVVLVGLGALGALAGYILVSGPISALYGATYALGMGMWVMALVAMACIAWLVAHDRFLVNRPTA